jgi:soluble cytochrome b562
MKIKLILCGFAASLMFVQSGVAEEETALGKQMEAMNDAYKAMRRETDTAKGAALAREAQDAMVKALIESPELVKAMPDGADKAKASAEYRKMMGSLISTLASMELAFLDNDLDKVKEIVGTMRDMKKEGHEKFMEED